MIKTKMAERLKSNQMSDTFTNAIFLTLSGGFQDAYTYNTRNEVFSNAQTGNVVLMSQHFMTGDWKAGVRYLLPLIAFVLGVFVADQIQMRYKYATASLEAGDSACRDRHIICRRIYSTQSEYDSDDFCVLCLCDAGADIPEDGWLFLCKYHVHR